MRKWMDFFSVKKRKRLDAVAVLVLLLAAFTYFRYGYQNAVLPEMNAVLENPWCVKTDDRGFTYVLDSERCRLLILNQDQKIENMIYGGAPDGNTFYYADDFCIGENGHIFLHDVWWSEEGFTLTGEAIIEYDEKGNFVKTLYEADYDELYTDKHRIFGISEENDTIRFVYITDNGCYLKTLDIEEAQEISSLRFDISNAYTYLQDVAICPGSDTAIALDKRGKILQIENGGVTTLYDSANADDTEKQAVFYQAAAGTDRIYLTDIYLDRLLVYEKDKAGQLQELAQGDDMWNVSVCGTSVSYVADNQITVLSQDGSVLFSGTEFEKSTGMKLRAVLYSAILGLMLIAGLYFVLRVLGIASTVHLQARQRTALIIAGTVTVVTLIIVVKMLNQFSDIYKEELLSKLNISAETVCSLIDVDALDQIGEPADYKGEDFNKVCSAMNTVIDKSQAENTDIYCNILKSNGDDIYAVIYQDDSIGCYYPLIEEDEKAARMVYETGETVQSDSTSETGSYIFVRVPIFGKDGKIHGITEVGTLSDILSNKISQMVRNILISLLMIVLIILFVFNEGFSFVDLFSSYQEKKKEKGKGRMVPLHIVRLLVFVTYMAFNIATSFLPVYISEFVSKDLGIPEALANSLPMTLNLICIGLTSLCCAKLMKWTGFRKLALAAALIALSGDLTLAFCRNYIMILLGLILNGIGVGLITNSIHIFIADSKAEEVQKEGFSIFNASSLSGINCGMMFGASLAGSIGKSKVFLLSSLMWILVLFCFFFFGSTISLSDGPDDSMQQKENRKEHRQGLPQFLRRPQVFGYMLCIQVPYIIMSSFNYYFVPLFCDENGYSEDISCLLIMLSSLCSVYLSVGLTNVLKERFRDKVLYLSSVLTLASIMLFAWKGTLPVLILALLMIGVANSFGTPSRADYFIEMEPAAEIGEGVALGIYDFVDNVGESAGPVVFSAIMSTGFLSGAAVLTGITAVLNGIYAFFHGRHKAHE